MTPLRILLVDASPRFIEAATRFLATDPHIEIIGFARSSHAALEQIARFHPDLVLLDVALPELNGLETTRRIKALTGAPCVVILALDDLPDYRAAAAAVGADGFIAKAEFGTNALPLIHALFGDVSAVDAKALTG